MCRMNGAETTLISCDSEGFVKVWDKRMMKCLGSIECGPHAANGIDFDRSGKLAALASEDCSVKMLDIEGMR